MRTQRKPMGGGAVAFIGVVARDVVKITEEKAAKVHAGAVISAERGGGQAA